MLIEQTRWGEYLGELSRRAEGYPTTIEIMAAGLGDQTEARSVPLRELAYDPHEGIAVSVGGTTPEHPVVLRHVIAHPQRLEVADEPGIPSALMIDDADGTRTLIRLGAPVATRQLTADERQATP
jgi:hypothetical protein